MKNDQDNLYALLIYLELNTKITECRMRAEHFYDMNDEVTSWEYLFKWIKAKETRSEMWEWFQDSYPDAVLAREGYYE